MKKPTSLFSKLISTCIVILMINLLTPSAYAVGPTVPTGPTGITGPTKITGPTEQTGPIEAPSQPTDSQPTTEEAYPAESKTVSDLISPQEGGTETNPVSNTAPPLLNSDKTVDTQISVINEAEINNNIDLDLNSGNNSVGSNTIVNSLHTGFIEGSVTILDLANSQLGRGSTFSSQNIWGGDQNILLNEAGPSMTIDISSENSDTGENSDNMNVYENNNIVEVFKRNSSVSNNTVDINADTGNNSLSNNTLIGEITTGDIDLGVNLINLLNVNMPNTTLSMDVWNILGDVNGDIVIENANKTTGPNSDNSNLVEIINNIEVTSSQLAEANNVFSHNLNTGNNVISDNTALGSVSTGDTNLLSNVTTISNIDTPIFYLFNVFGDWEPEGFELANNIFVNEINQQTGTNSTNLNVSEINNLAEIEIIDQAKANNTVNITANTGNNLIGQNTSVGNIKTGDIDISENLINIMNSFSEKVGNFAIKIINIFGNWKGKPTDTDEIDFVDNNVPEQETGPAPSSNPIPSNPNPKTVLSPEGGLSSPKPSTKSPLLVSKTSSKVTLASADNLAVAGSTITDESVENGIILGQTDTKHDNTDLTIYTLILAILAAISASLFALYRFYAFRIR